MIKLMFQIELVLIKQVYQKSMIFATIGTFQMKVLSFSLVFAMGVTMY